MPNRPKFLIAVAPHTSIWDFVFLYAAMLGIGFWSHWLMAKPFFRWPLGPIARWLGSTAVEKGSSREQVRESAREFERHERYVLGLAPEGTRERVHCDVWVDKPDATRALLGTASALV